MTQSDVFTIRRALISVSDKSGLVELATALHQANIDILSNFISFISLNRFIQISMCKNRKNFGLHVNKFNIYKIL